MFIPTPCVTRPFFFSQCHQCWLKRLIGNSVAVFGQFSQVSGNTGSTMIVVSSKGFISMAGHGHTDHAVPSYYPPEMGSLSSLPSCLNIKFGQYGVEPTTFALLARRSNQLS